MLGKARGSGLFALCALAALPSPARADDDELVLMQETSSFLDVADAFDDHDPFDVNISIGYVRTWEFGQIQREMNRPAAGDDRMSQHWLDVGGYNREINQLVFGLDVGIFRDLALYARLPILLSDDRSIGNSSAVSDRRVEIPGVPLTAPETLFGSSFRSPTRSGLDYLAAGLAWAILNQQRDPNVPNWLIMLEGRFNLGEPMHACNAGDPMGMQCLGDVDMATGQLTRTGNAGVGRGTNALRAEMRGSYRYEYMEPYAGLAFQIEWPGYGDRFFLPSGDLQGYINDRPPILGRLTLGMAIMPWEDRQHWQRFSIDFRFNGDYVSEGHDYSPLFDALGSSGNSQLVNQVLEGQPDMAMGAMGLRRVNFYGLTDTQSHPRIGGQVMVEMQAARYVRFSLAFAFMHSPSYVITQADACNPNVSGAPADDQRLVGTCRSGIINPHHRPVIDLPGQRFRMQSQTQLDISAYVTAQF
jgi:hypothetical protein